MEKRHLDRRLVQMRAEGTEFRCGVNVGVDVTAGELRARLRRDRAGRRRDRGPRACRCPAPSWTASTRRWSTCRWPTGVAAGRRRAAAPRSRRAGRHVVIIGGGDTGADCLGTAHRQGAASVTQLEIMPRPPEQRPDSQPWPTYPMIYRVSSAHEEGGERVYAVSTQEFLADETGRVRALRLVEVRTLGGRLQPGCRAPSASCAATSCCWPWGSPARSASGLLERPGRGPRPARQRGPGRLVRDLRARRVRRRRHGPRPVADRVGDRRGPVGRRRRRPLPGRATPSCPPRSAPPPAPSCSPPRLGAGPVRGWHLWTFGPGGRACRGTMSYR